MKKPLHFPVLPSKSTLLSPLVSSVASAQEWVPQCGGARIDTTFDPHEKSTEHIFEPIFVLALLGNIILTIAIVKISG